MSQSGSTLVAPSSPPLSPPPSEPLPPPPGPADIKTLEHWVIVSEQLSIALGILAIIGIILRLYVKLRMMKSIQADDYVLVVTFVLFVGVVILTLIICDWGMALNHGNMSVGEKIPTGAAALGIIYAACTICCKTSIAIMLARIFGPSNPFQRLAVYILLAISCLSAIVFSAFSLTCGLSSIQAIPHAGHCNLIRIANVVSLIWSCSIMVTDVGYALLCVHLIWSTTAMTVGTKIIASTLLSFASIGAFASILRVVTCSGYGYSTLDEQRVLLMRYSTLESGICFVAACLTTTKPLLQRCWTTRKLWTPARHEEKEVRLTGSVAYA